MTSQRRLGHDEVYRVNTSSLHVGDVLFSSGSNLMDKAIRVFDKGDFNHVALYIGSNQVIEATKRTGVVIANVRLWVLEDPSSVIVCRPKLPVNEPSLASEAFKLWLNGYNLQGAINVGLARTLGIPLLLSGRHKYFCSQFVAACYEAAGLQLVPSRSPKEISPQILFESDHLERLPSDTYLVRVPRHLMEREYGPIAGMWSTRYQSAWGHIQGNIYKRIKKEIAKSASGQAVEAKAFFDVMERHGVRQIPAILMEPTSETGSSFYAYFLLREHLASNPASVEELEFMINERDQHLREILPAFTTWSERSKPLEDAPEWYESYYDDMMYQGRYLIRQLQCSIELLETCVAVARACPPDQDAKAWVEDFHDPRLQLIIHVSVGGKDVRLDFPRLESAP